MSKTLLIHELWRTPAQGRDDSITLSPGVNVIVGAPNTGKTRWLESLDYLFGDDGKAEDKLGQDIAEKYDAIYARVQIGDQSVVLSRRWKEQGAKTKVFVDDTGMHTLEFQDWLLRMLGIPEVNYPQGNPYGDRAWPTLRFRSLLRHIYRRQRLWDDFADKQPESEQHACVMQFLGLASQMFSDSFAKMVSKEKRIHELEGRRESFVSILTEISQDLVGEAIPGVAITPAGLTEAISVLEADVVDLSNQRDDAVKQAIEASSASAEANSDVIEQLSARNVALRARAEAINDLAQAARERDYELRRFRAAADNERDRLRRAQSSSDLLSPLRVTHCPVCDRAVSAAGESEECYLCHRPIESDSEEETKRVAFEMEQLEAEIRELDELLTVLNDDFKNLRKERTEVENELVAVERRLQPTRRAILSVMPPQAIQFDLQIGTLQERINQVQRIRKSLARREELAAEVQDIRREVAQLEAEVAAVAATIDFEASADLIADGMNEYVNKLVIDGKKAWTQREIAIVLKERSFVAKVGKANWRGQLGGTLSLYFILAYHYALLTLRRCERCNYPGLCILDLPAEIEGTSIADKENFVLEPFVTLLQDPACADCQVIVAGSAFEGLAGANRVEFKHVWR